jgi:hypothetical protein
MSDWFCKQESKIKDMRLKEIILTAKSIEIQEWMQKKEERFAVDYWRRIAKQHAARRLRRLSPGSLMPEVHVL